MKYYYIYKITNKVNGKIYIGKRTTGTKPEEDNYLGSGKMIKWAINKYWKENFKKEVLELCTKDNLSEREIYYIELYNCRNNEIGYNIIEGGYGVGDLCHDRKTYYNPETDQEIRIKETENPPEGFIHGRRPFTEESIKKMARPGKLNGMYGVHRYGKANPFYGHKQSQKVIDRLKNTRKLLNPKTKEEKIIDIRKGIPKGFVIKKDYMEEQKQRQKFIKETKKKNLSNKKEEDLNLLRNLWSEQRKEFWKTKEVETCPYCGKQGRGAGFYRWHMENCRNHPTKGEVNKQMQKDLHKQLGEQLRGRKGTTQDKICINNGINNKFIYKEDLDKYPEYKIGMIKKK